MVNDDMDRPFRADDDLVALIAMLGRPPASPQDMRILGRLASGGMSSEIKCLADDLASGRHEARLGALFIGLEDVSTETMLDGLSVRATNVLGRVRIERQLRLSSMTPLQLRDLPNLGRKTFLEIVERVVRSWAHAQLRGSPPTFAIGPDSDREPADDAPQNAEPRDLHQDRLVRWERVLPDIEVVLRAMWRRVGASSAEEAIQWLGELPEGAKSAYESLRKVDLAEILGLAGATERAWATLLDFDDEDRMIMKERMFVGLDRKRLTLEELAQQQRVTRERIRQREGRVSKKLAERLELDDACQPIGHLAAATRRGVGPLTSAHEWFDAFGGAVRATGDADEGELNFRANVLASLADTYFLDGDVVMTAEARGRLDRLRAEIDAGPADRTIDPAEVAELVRGIGARAELSDAVVERIGIRRFEDIYVPWRRGAGDRAVAVLAATNTPMDFDELHDAVGFDTNPRSLANTVQSDPRCVRLGKSLYGLRSWGGIEYCGILSGIEDAVDAGGGRAQLGEIVEQISSRFAVSPLSVRAYAKDRRFQLEPDGALSMAPDETADAVPDVPPPEFVRGLYRLDGAWHLRIDVDSELLRGSGRPLRPAVAVAAGLEPGLVFGCRYESETVVFSWTGRTPIIGKLRPLAVAAGCADGDSLFLALEGEEPRAFRRVSSGHRRSARGLERVALEMGLGNTVSEAEIDPITAAVGLPAGADGVDLADRLRARREDELVGMLPTSWQ